MKIRALGALFAVLSLSSCTAGGEENGKPELKEESVEMDMQEAANTADEILDHSLSTAKPPVEWVHGETTRQACSDWKNEATEAGALTRRRAVLTIISEERRGNFLGMMESIWKRDNYRIVAVNRSVEHPAVHAETPDGFRIVLKFGYAGQAFFETSTPCAAKSDVAPPASRTDAPDYSGQEIPLPDRHSDFWSARTPVPSGGPEADGS